MENGGQFFTVQLCPMAFRIVTKFYQKLPMIAVNKNVLPSLLPQMQPFKRYKLSNGNHWLREKEHACIRDFPRLSIIGTDLAAWLEAGYLLEWDWVYISYLFLQLNGANLDVPVLTVPKHFKCFLGTLLADDFERSFSFQVRGTGKASCCLYYPSKTKPKTHHWINGYAVHICYSICIYDGFSFPLSSCIKGDPNFCSSFKFL